MAFWHKFHKEHFRNFLKQKNMDDLVLKGKWNMAKGRFKQRYAFLADDDLLYIEGQEEELLGRLQLRTGKTREELLEEINKLS